MPTRTAVNICRIAIEYQEVQDSCFSLTCIATSNDGAESSILSLSDLFSLIAFDFCSWLMADQIGCEIIQHFCSLVVGAGNTVGISRLEF